MEPVKSGASVEPTTRPGGTEAGDARQSSSPDPETRTRTRPRTPLTVLSPVPERGSLPVVGHALRLPTDRFVQYTMEEARALGPIYTLRVFGDETLVVSGGDLVAELCDETRFRKSPAGLEAVREFGGDGLFTAFNDEPNWRKANSILMPAFSFNALRAYHPTMLFAARRLLDTWDARAGSPVQVADDMTRLTLDTIGLCGFGYDFDCFGRQTTHPFVRTMVAALDHAQRKAAFLPGLDFLYARSESRQRENILAMNRLADDIVRRRRAENANPAPTGGSDAPDGVADLLSLMLHAKDGASGEPLDDTNIRYQMLTFLIAGHETTSGALSFALYYLLKHPTVLAAAQAEVDALWGGDPDPDPSFEDVGRLTYIRQVLNESLRLWPTAPGFSVEPEEDTVIGGRYRVRAKQPLFVLTPMLHRGEGWGDNPEMFDPDRFSPERVDARPGHLYKPFGNGERSCIGRQFALHEATLLLGLLIHRYRLLDHSRYELRIKETLTIKPDGFSLTPVRRTREERRTSAGATATAPAPASVPSGGGTPGEGLRAPGTTLTVLYGSRLGTCRALAGELAQDGARHGFATRVASLDEAVGTLTARSPVLVVAASYNGRPTDDAARFFGWLEQAGPGEVPEGMPYAVLGVGDRNWAATYQRVPTLIDERLTAAGATALTPRGAVDVSGDAAGETARWTGRVWSALLERYGVPAEEAGEVRGGHRYTVEDAGGARTPVLPVPEDLHPLTVTENRELCDLTHPVGRSKRFLRLSLPADTADTATTAGTTGTTGTATTATPYRSGDHLVIRPANPTALVDRVWVATGLNPDRTVVLGAGPAAGTGADDPLPLGEPMTVRTLLTHLVELGQPATARQATALAEATPCPPERAALERYAADPGRLTVVDLLEQHASCQPSLPALLDVLTPTRLRTYSISSTPALSPGAIDLMVAAAPVPHRTGEGTWTGAGAAYLAALEPGATVHGRVMPCQESFRLPDDPSVPVILVSAGTGLAPFRAAVADRAASTAPDSGRAPLLCYFGCDHPEVDYLHREELEAAEAASAGAVSLRPAHSAAPENGVQYVQDRLLRESAEVWGLLARGAHVRVCGDGRRMAPAVRAALAAIYEEWGGDGTLTGEEWLNGLRDEGRYAEDVWAG
ncbi:cytochrome P450 [Streptomyces sp. NPDC057638]|uniref:cytochrome P450 n=1 Tax=Streptomyces sp. NPDC057638 TaxID=3346190 RepID=UPI0036B23A5D